MVRARPGRAHAYARHGHAQHGPARPLRRDRRGPGPRPRANRHRLGHSLPHGHRHVSHGRRPRRPLRRAPHADRRLHRRRRHRSPPRLAFSFVSLALAVFIASIVLPTIPTNVHKTCAVWFSGKRLGTANGVVSAGMALGFMLGAMLSATVLSPLLGGWRGVMYFYAAIAIAVGVVWIFMQDGPDGEAHRFRRRTTARRPRPGCQTARRLAVDAGADRRRRVRAGCAGLSAALSARHRLARARRRRHVVPLPRHESDRRHPLRHAVRPHRLPAPSAYDCVTHDRNRRRSACLCGRAAHLGSRHAGRHGPRRLHGRAAHYRRRGARRRTAHRRYRHRLCSGAHLTITRHFPARRQQHGRARNRARHLFSGPCSRWLGLPASG